MRSERTVAFSAPAAAVGLSDTWLMLIGPVSGAVGVAKIAVATVVNFAMNTIGAIGGAPAPVVAKRVLTTPRGFASRRNGAETAVFGNGDWSIFCERSARLSVGVVASTTSRDCAGASTF